MEPHEAEAFFTRGDGSYLFSRWGRPIVPVVFGVDDATLSVVKGAVEAVVVLANHKMAETDPELGANLMFFFFRDWSELPEVPKLDRMVPELGALCDRLQATGANQYRFFRFDADGAIKAAFVFVRMDRRCRIFRQRPWRSRRRRRLSCYGPTRLLPQPRRWQGRVRSWCCGRKSAR